MLAGILKLHVSNATGEELQYVFWPFKEVIWLNENMYHVSDEPSLRKDSTSDKRSV